MYFYQDLLLGKKVMLIPAPRTGFPSQSLAKADVPVSLVAPARAGLLPLRACASVFFESRNARASS
jgi:hypothetical protein